MKLEMAYFMFLGCDIDHYIHRQVLRI